MRYGRRNRCQNDSGTRADPQWGRLLIELGTKAVDDVRALGINQFWNLRPANMPNTLADLRRLLLSDRGTRGMPIRIGAAEQSLDWGSRPVANNDRLKIAPSAAAIEEHPR